MDWEFGFNEALMNYMYKTFFDFINNDFKLVF